MIIYIRSMVCVRCKMAVKSVLKELEIDYTSIDLGVVKLPGDLSDEQYNKLDTALKYYELELIDNKRMILVERVKTLIIEIFRPPHEELQLKLSEYLSKMLDHDYTYMANTFSEMDGQTIERFYISTRIERAKEMLVYEALSVKEIAYRLNYSSESHLCLQFKKITGKTPKGFKKMYEAGDYMWKTCE